MKKIIYFILFFSFLCNVNAQNKYAMLKKLENENLVRKGAASEYQKKDTTLQYCRLECLEDILRKNFENYDDLTSAEKNINELKKRKEKGEKLEIYELKSLGEAAKKPTIVLRDTCRRLINVLSKHNIISTKVKADAEEYLKKGNNNPADLLNLMHYNTAEEGLLDYRSIEKIVNEYEENQMLFPNAKDSLLNMAKKRKTFDFLNIYKACKGFSYIEKPNVIKDKQSLGSFITKCLTITFPNAKIIDCQVITEKDSVFDYVYDEVKDTSIWGLYEVYERDFFTFKMDNETYKYPLSFSTNGDGNINLKSFVKGDFMNNILLQVATDLKAPYLVVMLNIADDVTRTMYGDYLQHLDRVIPPNKLERYAIWKVGKNLNHSISFWLFYDRTYEPRIPTGGENIVSTKNKYKVINEAEKYGFLSKMSKNELKNFKTKVAQTTYDEEYSILTEIPNIMYGADLFDCNAIWNSYELKDFESHYTSFFHQINSKLDSALTLKKLSVTAKDKTHHNLVIETSKKTYTYVTGYLDDPCEAIFPAMIEICEAENTKKKVYVMRGLKRIYLFVSDMQAAYLNKKYELNVLKKY